MPRQDHWNKVGEGEGEVDRVRELCDMVSVNIIINILVNINLHDIQNKLSISLYLHFSYCIINHNIRLNITITSAISQCIHAALAMD